MQGFLAPDLWFSYYLTLFNDIKSNWKDLWEAMNRLIADWLSSEKDMVQISENVYCDWKSPLQMHSGADHSLNCIISVQKDSCAAHLSGACGSEF
jgi:hypothetical protein